MASVCDVCGKRPGFGKSVSHSHRRTSRRWNPNVQTVRALVAGLGLGGLNYGLGTWLGERRGPAS